MGSQRVGHDLVIEQQHKYLFLYMRVLVLKSGSRQVYTIGGRVQVQSLTSIHRFFLLGHAPCYVKDIRKPHFDLWANILPSVITWPQFLLFEFWLKKRLVKRRTPDSALLLTKWSWSITFCIWASISSSTKRVTNSLLRLWWWSKVLRKVFKKNIKCSKGKAFGQLLHRRMNRDGKQFGLFISHNW